MEKINAHIIGQTAIFKFEEKRIKDSFSATFTSFDQADNAGSPVLARIVRAPYVEKVQLDVRNGICGIAITLDNTKNWSQIVSSGGSKTLADQLGEILHVRFIQEKTPVITPESSEHWKPDYIEKLKKLVQEFAKQTQMSEHGGTVKVIDYDPATRSLTMEFDGSCRSSTCASKEFPGGRNATERELTSKICQAVPRAVSAAHIRFVDAKHN